MAYPYGQDGWWGKPPTEKPDWFKTCSQHYDMEKDLEKFKKSYHDDDNSQDCWIEKDNIDDDDDGSTKSMNSEGSGDIWIEKGDLPDDIDNWSVRSFASIDENDQTGGSEAENDVNTDWSVKDSTGYDDRDNHDISRSSRHNKSSRDGKRDSSYNRDKSDSRGRSSMSSRSDHKDDNKRSNRKNRSQDRRRSRSSISSRNRNKRSGREGSRNRGNRRSRSPKRTGNRDNRKPEKKLRSPVRSRSGVNRRDRKRNLNSPRHSSRSTSPKRYKDGDGSGRRRNLSPKILPETLSITIGSKDDRVVTLEPEENSLITRADNMVMSTLPQQTNFTSMNLVRSVGLGIQTTRLEYIESAQQTPGSLPQNVGLQQVGGATRNPAFGFVDCKSGKSQTQGILPQNRGMQQLESVTRNPPFGFVDCKSSKLQTQGILPQNRGMQQLESAARNPPFGFVDCKSGKSYTTSVVRKAPGFAQYYKVEEVQTNAASHTKAIVPLGNSQQAMLQSSTGINQQARQGSMPYSMGNTQQARQVNIPFSTGNYQQARQVNVPFSTGNAQQARLVNVPFSTVNTLQGRVANVPISMGNYQQARQANLPISTGNYQQARQANLPISTGNTQQARQANTGKTQQARQLPANVQSSINNFVEQVRQESIPSSTVNTQQVRQTHVTSAANNSQQNQQKIVPSSTSGNQQQTNTTSAISKNQQDKKVDDKNKSENKNQQDKKADDKNKLKTESKNQKPEQGNKVADKSKHETESKNQVQEDKKADDKNKPKLESKNQQDKKDDDKNKAKTESKIQQKPYDKNKPKTESKDQQDDKNKPKTESKNQLEKKADDKNIPKAESKNQQDDKNKPKTESKDDIYISERKDRLKFDCQGKLIGTDRKQLPVHIVNSEVKHVMRWENRPDLDSLPPQQPMVRGKVPTPCLLPECTFVGLRLKRHTYSNHIPSIFKEDKWYDNMESCGDAIEQLVLWIYGSKGKEIDLCTLLNTSELMPKGCEIRQLDYPHMRTLCKNRGWPYRDSFYLHPINSPACLIHWRAMLMALLYLTESRRKLFKQMYNKAATMQNPLTPLTKLNPPTSNVTTNVTSNVKTASNITTVGTEKQTISNITTVGTGKQSVSNTMTVGRRKQSLSNITTVGSGKQAVSNITTVSSGTHPEVHKKKETTQRNLIQVNLEYQKDKTTPANTKRTNDKSKMTIDSLIRPSVLEKSHGNIQEKGWGTPVRQYHDRFGTGARQFDDRSGTGARQFDDRSSIDPSMSEISKLMGITSFGKQLEDGPGKQQRGVNSTQRPGNKQQNTDKSPTKQSTVKSGQQTSIEEKGNKSKEQQIKYSPRGQQNKDSSLDRQNRSHDQNKDSNNLERQSKDIFNKQQTEERPDARQQRDRSPHERSSRQRGEDNRKERSRQRSGNRSGRQARDRKRTPDTMDGSLRQQTTDIQHLADRLRDQQPPGVTYEKQGYGQPNRFLEEKTDRQHTPDRSFGQQEIPGLDLANSSARDLESREKSQSKLNDGRISDSRDLYRNDTKLYPDMRSEFLRQHREEVDRYLDASLKAQVESDVFDYGHSVQQRGRSDTPSMKEMYDPFEMTRNIVPEEPKRELPSLGTRKLDPEEPKRELPSLATRTFDPEDPRVQLLISEISKQIKTQTEPSKEVFEYGHNRTKAVEMSDQNRSSGLDSLSRQTYNKPLDDSRHSTVVQDNLRSSREVSSALRGSQDLPGDLRTARENLDFPTYLGPTRSSDEIRGSRDLTMSSREMSRYSKDIDLDHCGDFHYSPGDIQQLPRSHDLSRTSRDGCDDLRHSTGTLDDFRNTRGASDDLTRDQENNFRTPRDVFDMRSSRGVTGDMRSLRGVPDDTRSLRGLPDDMRNSQGVSGENISSREALNDLRDHRRMADDLIGSKRQSDEFRGSREMSDEFRGLTGVPDKMRSSRGALDDIRGSYSDDLSSSREQSDEFRDRRGMSDNISSSREQLDEFRGRRREMSDDISSFKGQSDDFRGKRGMSDDFSSSKGQSANLRDQRGSSDDFRGSIRLSDDTRNSGRFFDYTRLSREDLYRENIPETVDTKQLRSSQDSVRSRSPLSRRSSSIGIEDAPKGSKLDEDPQIDLGSALAAWSAELSLDIEESRNSLKTILHRTFSTERKSKEKSGSVIEISSDEEENSRDVYSTRGSPRKSRKDSLKEIWKEVESSDAQNLMSSLFGSRMSTLGKRSKSIDESLDKMWNAVNGKQTEQKPKEDEYYINPFTGEKKKKTVWDMWQAVKAASKQSPEPKEKYLWVGNLLLYKDKTTENKWKLYSKAKIPDEAKPGAPQGYGAPPGQPGYGAPPPGQPGYGAPPGQPGYAPPPGQPGYPGAPPPQQIYGGGGYGGPPPGIDPSVYQWFMTVDQDKSGQITAHELQQALVNGNWSHFNPETCRLMISMFDKDHSGTIQLHEFQALWNYIQQWKGVFEKFDTNRSGAIEAHELSPAYQQMGYNLSQQFVATVIAKFDVYGRRTLTLDNFIQSCVMLKSLTDSFKQRDPQMQGVVRMSYEDFMTTAVFNKI